jgi:fumarate hydratase subunit beta
MDAFAPTLLDLGLKIMIGKGGRNSDVIEAMGRNGAVYLAATGGAAALIMNSVKKSEVICFNDLGAEAIRRLEVEDFPAIVATLGDGQTVYK